MHAQVLYSSLVLASCFVNPARETSPPRTPSGSSALVADYFPLPKEGLAIKGTDSMKPTLMDLLSDFSRVSGQHLLIGKDTLRVLESLLTGFTEAFDVPPQEVYSFVETVMAHNDIVLIPERETEPRLMGVVSLNAQSRTGLRNTAIFVPEKELAVWARHPAILITTMVNLPNIDVRTLSNSLRSMFTDANTQQIIPVGNTNGLLLTGFGSSVVAIVSMLRECDALEKANAERLKKEGVEAPAVKAPAPKEKEGKKE